MDRSSLRRGRRALALCLSFSGLALLALGAASAAPALGSTPVWAATAAGPGGVAAAGRVVVRDPRSGALYVAGSARVSARVSEIMVVKYNAAGVQQWTATYRHSGGGTQTAVDGALDKAGDFVVLCAVSGLKTGGDWAVLDYAPDGTLTWATTIAGVGAGNDPPGRLALSPTGAIYAAGGLFAAHHGLVAALVKLTSSGKVAWKRVVAGHGGARFSALGLDRAGRVFCAGAAPRPVARAGDCVMAAYSPAGRRLWIATWGGPAHLPDGVSDLVVTPAGKACAVGWFGTKSGSRAMMRQYNAGGRFVWQGTYAMKGGGRARFVAAAPLPQGRIVATGTLANAATGNRNIVTIGVGTRGHVLWQRVWDTPHPPSGFSKDQARDVVVDATGRVFVGGYVPTSKAAGADFAVFAYTSKGAPIHRVPRTWNGGAGDDFAWDLTLAPGGVVVTGQSWTRAGRFRMATVELPY